MLALDMWHPVINHVRCIHLPRLVLCDSLHMHRISQVSENERKICLKSLNFDPDGGAGEVNEDKVLNCSGFIPLCEQKASI